MQQSNLGAVAAVALRSQGKRRNLCVYLGDMSLFINLCGIYESDLGPVWNRIFWK